MMKKLILISISIMCSIFLMCSQQSERIKLLDVNDFKKEIAKKDNYLIDVRTAQEYESGHIENAINVDIFNRNAFIKYVNSLDKEKPVLLYCRSGSRSNDASKLLVELGFKKIYDLKGGYLNWMN